MIFLAAICVALLVALVIEKLTNARETRVREDAWRLERTGLLNRIQAPEAAPFIDTGEPELQHAHFEDDEEYHAAQEEVPEWP